MKLRTEHYITRVDAERFLLVTRDLPTSKESFLKFLRHSLWWYGQSEGCGQLDDEVRVAVDDHHDAEHDGCGGPEFCDDLTQREQAVKRLLADYWDGS